MRPAIYYFYNKFLCTNRLILIVRRQTGITVVSPQVHFAPSHFAQLEVVSPQLKIVSPKP